MSESSEDAPRSVVLDRLAIALDAARLGEWDWNAITDVMTLSPRAAEIYGVSAGEAGTRTALRELLHPEDRERQKRVAAEAIRKGEDYVIDYRIGADRWVSVTGRARYDAEGVLVGMFGVVQDITNDRLLLQIDDAARPLLGSEQITFAAARTLGRHLRVNRCAYAVVESDEDTFVLTGDYNDGVATIVGTYRFRQFGAECLRLMRSNEPWVVEDATVDPRLDDDDRKAYAHTEIRAVICVPIHKSGRFVAAMAVHTKTTRRWLPNEITLLQQVASRCWESIERAHVERERVGLLHAAEAANRAKDEFLAMLGHELRNPLAPINTALQLMRLRSDANERERTVIERQVAHLTRLVDDLLDVSRIARGKVELKHERVELAEICARAIEVASPLFEQRAHSLVVEVPRTGLAVYGDAARLIQVVSNLLTNAGKYTPPGGRIVVSGLAVGPEAVLTVRDNGIGMSAEVLPRIFDLFVQGNQQEIDRAHGGLGLGLTITKSLVERHGGRVAARSAGANLGSEVEVRLPLSEPGAATPAPSREAAILPIAPRERPVARVLVVDDNEDAAEMLAAALDHLGVEVDVAHDGPSALRIVETESFDAALLDIGLPVMDGYELAARLRAHPGAGGMKLVAVTGYGQDDDRKRATAAGFDLHLVKPVDLRAVAAILEAASKAPRTTKA